MSTQHFMVIITLTFAHCILAANLRYERAYAPKSIINPDDVYNEMEYADPRNGYRWPWSKEFQDIDMDKGILPAQALDKFSENYKSEEMLAEPLPVPRALIKSPTFKKSGYQLSICHFKICNMGRKRDARFLHYPQMINNEK